MGTRRADNGKGGKFSRRPSESWDHNHRAVVVEANYHHAKVEKPRRMGPRFRGDDLRSYARTITSIAPFTIASGSLRATGARARMAMVWRVADASCARAG